MEIQSQNRRIQVSAQKLRMVVDLVRGKDVNEALAVLNFTPNKSAVEVARTIKAAQADAENVYDLDPDALYVKTIYADEGPTYRRWRARARGRVNRRLKRTSHLTVVLAERGEDD
ncbi:MAG TPA: 50S ribosomal protein L22 [Thermomicrobiales bacterium]|nr:50S ribosomal protein L22 [Thermomicrobiales bacterium]